MNKETIKMSAGIVLMNKEGVSIAADSAVTIGNRSAIFNTSDKLFNISSDTPVGIVIYGNADFMGIPLSVIIKDYAKEINNQKIVFSQLKEYLDYFLEYLRKKRIFTIITKMHL